MKAHTILLSIIAVMAAAVLILQVFPPSGSHPGGSTEDPEKIREYASQLKANQLYEKSAEAYDRYVAVSNRPEAEKANIDFNTGTMLLDQVGDAEEALARFLRVTHLYSEADPKIKKEARRLAAECLEKLGRSGAAERQLIEATRLQPKDSTAEEKTGEADILASIGDRVSITRNDFEEVWKEIPQEVRQREFAGAEGKRRFLQEMVASKLYSEAARRKGYDRDPQLRRRLQTLEESFLANRLLQEEIAAKVTLSDSDLRIYFEANKAHYAVPETFEAAHILLADASSALAARAAVESGSAFEEVAKNLSLDASARENGGKLGLIRKPNPALVGDPPIDPLEVSIPGVGKERALAEAIFSLGEDGEIAGPIQTGRGFHLIQLIGRTEAVEQDFERAKPFVERDLRARKEREMQAELAAELTKIHKVRVHEERLE